MVVVVVATPPLAAADHCHPTIGFNRQEPRPGASRRKGGSLRSTEEPLILQPSRTRSLYLYCREKWDTGKKLLLLYFTLHQSHNTTIVGLLSAPLIRLFPTDFTFYLLRKYDVLYLYVIALSVISIRHEKPRWWFIRHCIICISALLFSYSDLSWKYRNSIFNIKLQKNKIYVVISNVCFEGFHPQCPYI